MSPHTLTDLLTALHPPDAEGFIDLRALPSKRQTFIRPSDIEAVQRFIITNGDQDLYFGVATRKSSGDGSLVNCGELYAIFVDIDFKTISEADARATLERFPLKPSIVVASGGGLHIYFMLKEPLDLQQEADRAKGLLRRLALSLDGDLAPAEPARILRVPGTLNYKYTPPRRVLVEVFNPDRAYNVCDFDDMLPEEPEPMTNGNGRGFTVGEKIKDGERNTTLYKLARSMKAKGLSGAAILAALRAENQAKCEPPLPDTEVEKIAEHATEQPDRPEFVATGNSNGGDPLTAIRALPDEPSPEAVEAALRGLAATLAGADPLRRERVRVEAVTILKSKKVASATRFIDAAFGMAKATPEAVANAIFLADPEPWPEPIDGAVLLDEIERAITRYVVAPREAAAATALWIIFSHAHEVFDISPILAITSATMRCGKSLLMQIVSAFVPKALTTSNITPAGLFRGIEAYSPTLLIDEGDAFLSFSEELRGILNSGHTRRAAVVIRTVGEDFEPRTFTTWCPKLLALIGKLPGTLADRSIEIRLVRKTKGEAVERFRSSRLAALAPLCQQVARWVADHGDALKAADPDVPTSLNDRAADNWRPLLAIADAVGGEWPDRARKAALTLSGEAVEENHHGVTLIGDIMAIFNVRQVDELATSDLIAALVNLEERPWSEWRRGRQITPRGVAGLLKPFRIVSKVIRFADGTQHGYARKALEDVYTRYFDPSYPKHPNEINNLDPIFYPKQDPDVSDTQSAQLCGNKGDIKDVSDVSDRNPECSGKEEGKAELDVTDPTFEARCAADLGDLFDSEEVIV